MLHWSLVFLLAYQDVSEHVWSAVCVEPCAEYAGRLPQTCGRRLSGTVERAIIAFSGIALSRIVCASMTGTISARVGFCLLQMPGNGRARVSIGSFLSVRADANR